MRELLEQSVQIELGKVKEADILIGIPSYNNARTIGHVVRAVTAGLAKYFPGARAVLVNSDGGSTDGTQEEVKGYRLKISERYSLRTRFIPFIRSSHPTMETPGKEAPSGPSLNLPSYSTRRPAQWSIRI